MTRPRARRLPLVVVASTLLVPLYAMACTRESASPAPPVAEPRANPDSVPAATVDAAPDAMATTTATTAVSAASDAAPDGAPGPKSVAGPTAAECRALYDAAQRSAVSSWNRASKDCLSDADCVPASKRGCLGECSASPIAKSAFPAWKREFDRLEATTCRKYWEGNCAAKVPMPVPTCPAPRVACQGGKCTG